MRKFTDILSATTRSINRFPVKGNCSGTTVLPSISSQDQILPFNQIQNEIRQRPKATVQPPSATSFFKPIPPAQTTPSACLGFADIRQLTRKPSKQGRELGAVFKKNEWGLAISDLCNHIIDIIPLMEVDNALYFLDGFVWRPIGPEELTRKLRSTNIRELLAPLSTRELSELYHKLRTDPRIFREPADVHTNQDIIVGNDGVFDLLTGSPRNGRPEDYIFAPNDFSVYQLGHGSGPHFESYIDSLCNGDTTIRQLLLEVIGVTISGYLIKAFFLLLGETNTGKSQITSLCQKLVGKQNTFAIGSLNDLSGTYTLGSLVGKKLCICADAPKEILSNKTIGIVNQLTGKDPVLAEQKYKQPFSYINQAKLLFASNHPLQLPNMLDNRAFSGRIVTVPFFNSIPREDWINDLEYLLYEERNYIVGQAIEALLALKARNFTFTKVNARGCESVAVPESLNNSVELFVETCCVFDKDSLVQTQELFESYCFFCEDNGQASLVKPIFARTLSQKYPELSTVRGKWGPDSRGFSGISIH